MTTTTMTGALIAPACAGSAARVGHRERSGIAGFTAVSPLFKGITLSNWSVVDPTPLLVRHRGAPG